MIKKPIGPKRDELKISEDETDERVIVEKILAKNDQMSPWNVCETPEWKEQIEANKEFMELGKVMLGIESQHREGGLITTLTCLCGNKTVYYGDFKSKSRFGNLITACHHCPELYRLSFPGEPVNIPVTAKRLIEEKE